MVLNKTGLITEVCVYMLNYVSSSMREINIGAPQVFILGPLLFLIIINDLADSIPNMKAILFADDTTVFSTEF